MQLGRTHGLSALRHGPADGRSAHRAVQRSAGPPLRPDASRGAPVVQHRRHSRGAAAFRGQCAGLAGRTSGDTSENRRITCWKACIQQER